MNIVLIIGEGSNHKALANKVSNKFDLVGVIIEKKKLGKESLVKILSKIVDRILFSSISHSWRKLMDYYNHEFQGYPLVDNLRVDNVNSYECISFIRKKEVDLVAVSGTSILRKSTLNSLKVKLGIMNLHTGLSPYVKGGPNCTNWCISNDTVHLIGNTIMWINEGIDSGNIIATECTSFDGNESLFEVHFKVMEHAHNLYLNVLKIQLILSSTLKSIPQNEIGVGKLFITKNWQYKEKKNLVKNFKLFSTNINSFQVDFKKKQLRLVDCMLDSGIVDN